MRHVLFLALMFLATPAVVEAVPIEKNPVRTWIEQLNSDSFRKREQASRELEQLGEKALPLLREAVKSPNAEVADRAAKLVRKIQRNLDDNEALAILADIATDGLLDFVVKMTRNEDFANSSRWNAVHKLADRVRECAEKKGGAVWLAGPVGSLDGEVIRQFHPNARVLLEQASKAELVAGCTVLSKTSMAGLGTVSGSILIVDGHLRANVLNNCLVICSGQVNGTIVKNCIVLCKSGFRAVHATGSFIEAGNEARATTEARDCVVFNTPQSSGFERGGNKTLTDAESLIRHLHFKEKTRREPIAFPLTK